MKKRTRKKPKKRCRVPIRRNVELDAHVAAFGSAFHELQRALVSALSDVDVRQVAMAPDGFFLHDKMLVRGKSVGGFKPFSAPVECHLSDLVEGDYEAPFRASIRDAGESVRRLDDFLLAGFNEVCDASGQTLDGKGLTRVEAVIKLLETMPPRIRSDGDSYDVSYYDGYVLIFNDKGRERVPVAHVLAQLWTHPGFVERFGRLVARHVHAWTPGVRSF